MTVVAIVQGVYFLITGVWPLVHMDSFQKVTGPKTDLWLVRTTGILITIIGAGLIVAGINDQLSPGLILIAMASAGGLMGIELFYVLKKVISPVYVMDAIVEFGLILWWALALIFA